MRIFFLTLPAIALAFGLLSVHPASASVISNVTDYNNGIYFAESGTIQANSSAVFEYTLSPDMATSILAISQLVNRVTTSNGGSTTRVAVGEYSLSDPNVLSLSGGSGFYNYGNAALAKDQITLSGNDLFITLVNYSPTNTYTFINQFTQGGAPAVVRGTIVSQGSLSAVPLPASFPLFVAAMAGLAGFGVYRKRQTV